MPLTLEEVRELIGTNRSQPNSHSLKVGTAYLFRTATLYYTGRIAAITDADIVLSEAAWIACTGRFSDLMKDGTHSGLEVEPFPGSTIINRTMIVDATEWVHELPRKQK